MAEIIPSLTKEVLSHMTSGEKRLAQRLKELLEEDYLVWYDIPVGRQRRYPDFIVLHPARGLLFLEVKDWYLNSLVKIDKYLVHLHLNSGLKKVSNPLEQARQCMMQVVNRLKADTQMCFGEDSPFAGKIAVPYGYGAVLANITRKQMQEAINTADREIVLPDHLVIYKDEMSAGVDPEIFQKQLWDMFQFRFKEKLTVPQIDRVRWHLFPEVRISEQKQLNLDTERIETESPQMPDIVRILDIQQEQLARSLGSGHRVIHGVAGSGKTLILGYRAELLATIATKPVLVLCYNISLARKLNSIMVHKGLSERVTVLHFHDWCGRQLKTYHVDVLSGEEEYWERQVNSVIAAVEAGYIPRAQYGAVLIDEGHDFEATWLKLITQMVHPDSDSLLLLYDDAQSIYQKRSGLGFSLSSVGIKAQGRTTILRLNYRNTHEILTFAYHVAADVLNAHDSDEDHIPLLMPESAGSHGSRPEVALLPSWEGELSHCLTALRKWYEQGIAWREMAVLYCNSYQGQAIANLLKYNSVPNYWLGASAYKKAYDPHQDQVAIMSIHSSKGLEFPAVILVGTDKLNCNQQLNDNIRLLYVGMTRAQKYLMLSCSAETIITQRLLSEAC